MHCSSVESIIIHRVMDLDFDHDQWTDRGYWAGCSMMSWGFSMRWSDRITIPLHDLTSITFLASTFAVSVPIDEPSPGGGYHGRPLVVPIPRLRIEWTSDRLQEIIKLNLDHLIWPYPPEQRDWVAKYAVQLPEEHLRMFANKCVTAVRYVLLGPSLGCFSFFPAPLRSIKETLSYFSF